MTEQTPLQKLNTLHYHMLGNLSSTAHAVEQFNALNPSEPLDLSDLCKEADRRIREAYSKAKTHFHNHG